MSENSTTAFLPPYAPALNAIERFWCHLGERCSSHRACPDHAAILDAA